METPAKMPKLEAIFHEFDDLLKRNIDLVQRTKEVRKRLLNDVEDRGVLTKPEPEVTPLPDDFMGAVPSFQRLLVDFRTSQDKLNSELFKLEDLV